jgi:hypothetical protein
VLGYYCFFVIFGKVHFTAVIMPIFFLGLTGINFIGVIFLAKWLNTLLQNHVCRQFSAQGPTEDRRGLRCLFGKNRELAGCFKNEFPQS